MSEPLPVSDAYATWAATYDTCENRTRDVDAALLRASNLPLDGARIVEIGAGTGKNTVHLAAYAGRVTALDLSGAMLAAAARRGLGAHVRLVEHDITLPWPVPDADADLVVGNLVLEHVARLETRLRPGAPRAAARWPVLSRRDPPLPPMARQRRALRDAHGRGAGGGACPMPQPTM